MKRTWSGKASNTLVRMMLLALAILPAELTRAAAADPARPGVFVGLVGGTDAMIALVVVGDEATAFVAGGAETLTSLSGYFEGGVSRGQLRLTEANTSGGRSITGRLSASSASGTLQLDNDVQLSWSASLADSRNGGGFYLYADKNALTGAIVNNAGKLQGVSRSLKTGRLSRLSPATARKTGDIQKVSIPGPRRGELIPLDLFRIRRPIEGLIRLWGYEPQGGAASQAATQSIIPATDSFGNLINPWDVTVLPSGSEDLADIILVSDFNTKNIFAFDTCSDPPTLQLTGSGTFTGLRDISMGPSGLAASDTTSLSFFEILGPDITFQASGFARCDDISFNPANDSFLILDAGATATVTGVSTFGAGLYEMIPASNPQDVEFRVIKEKLAQSDANFGNGTGRRYASAIAYGDDYLVAWNNRFAGGIDRISANGTQTSFSGLTDSESRLSGIPRDMVLLGDDVIVAVVRVGLAGTALLRVAPDRNVTTLITPVGEFQPNGLTVERHLNDAHIIVADWQPPPPDAAHGGTDDPVGGNIVRVFPDSDSELAHNVRLVQCQAGF